MTGGGRLRIAVLGSFRVSRDGQQVDLGPRLQRALLAILVLEAGHVVPVDRLIDLLWREDPPAAALASVQAYVSQLRRVLEPGRPARAPARVLVTQDPGYLLRVGDDQVDALRFAALARQAHADLAAGRPAAAAAGLAAALALWRGDPLAEFAAEPWAVPAVTRLTEAHDLAAEDRIDAALALGGHAQAAAELEAMVAARPLRERRWGQLILATYRCDRQADALRAYQRCRTMLADELGLEPGPGLQRLEAAVLAQDASLDWHPAAAGTEPASPDAAPGQAGAQPAASRPPPTKPPVPSLVGRGAELAYLRGRLRQVASGDGGAVVLVGEPGAGKTLLAEAGARLAVTAGVTTAWGRCPDAATTPAYWPWSQVLRALPDGPSVRAARRRLNGEVAGEGDDGARQFQAYQAVAAALGEAAAVAPVLAVIDGLHAADDASLALLQLLAGDLYRIPALFLFTVRDTEHSPALDQALGELLRHPGAERVAVSAFEPSDVAALVERLTSEPPPPGVVAALMSRTGGNPFYTTELVRLIGSEHRCRPLTAGDVQSHDVPSGIRDVLLRRIGRLPDDAQSLLVVAAVAGRELEPELLERVTGLDAEHLLLDLEPAIAAGLVTAADGGWGFRFRHPLIQESLYASIGRAERARLHARVAAALEDISPAGTADVVQLAYHYLSAGPVGEQAKAVRYAREAAGRAVSQAAWQDAVRHLEQALAVWSPALPDADVVRCDVLVELGQARRSAGLMREAHRAFEEAISLADRIGDEDRRIAAAREDTIPAGLHPSAVTGAEVAFELSVRELEVARLVADGLSNPAIASALFISVATVKTHVSHILAKLGLDSRVQLVSWVAGRDPSPPAPGRRVGNIPSPVSSFVGRAGELEQTAAVLGESRMVTLTGAGGVGKTRLALQAAAQVARRFADGAWLAELAPVRDAAGGDDAVAAVFSVTARAGQGTRKALVEFLRAKELLLVLDNCEHLLVGVAALAQVLARSCPRLVILATSREGLGIDGEQLVPVPPLAVPGADADLDTILEAEAVRLFGERAAAVKRGFAVTEQNAAAVAAVCRRLDGLPLAIELAAARVPAMTPAELARRLERSFAVLASGRRGAAAHHQTLRAAIDWSFQLLTEPEQALLARLAVFAGGATLQAAEAVCRGEGIDPDAVFGLLASLVARSLVVAEEHGPQSRYRLLETIRQYGEEHIGQSGEAERWRARHAGYYADLLRQVRDQTLEPRDEVFWAVRLSAEQDNLLAAWSWAIGAGNVDAAFSILAGFAPCEIWNTYPLLLPGSLALELPGAAGHPGFPLALAVTAVFSSVRGDVTGAEELCRRAAEANAHRDTPDWRVEETICGARENIATTRGAFADAARLAEQTAGIAWAGGDLADASLKLAIAAADHVLIGDTSAAVPLANEALSLARQIGTPALVSTGLLAVGAAVAGTDPEQARACLRESHDLSAALAYNSLIDHVLATGVAFRTGDRAATLELGRNAIRGLQWGGGLGMGIILHTIADALSETRPDPAAIIHGAADAYAVAPPNPAGPGSLAGPTAPHRARAQELRARGANMGWHQVIAYTLTQVTQALNELHPPPSHE
jgi:predicted ATPase/DNA-binding SARP family transcriptional activator/DNA-binding CsgD family transcriptional regulator